MKKLAELIILPDMDSEGPLTGGQGPHDREPYIKNKKRF